MSTLQNYLQCFLRLQWNHMPTHACSHITETCKQKITNTCKGKKGDTKSPVRREIQMRETIMSAKCARKLRFLLCTVTWLRWTVLYQLSEDGSSILLKSPEKNSVFGRQSSISCRSPNWGRQRPLKDDKVHGRQEESCQSFFWLSPDTSSIERTLMKPNQDIKRVYKKTLSKCFLLWMSGGSQSSNTLSARLPTCLCLPELHQATSHSLLLQPGLFLTVTRPRRLPPNLGIL